MSKKNTKATLQFFKAIQIKADRGKVKSCQLCLKDFGFTVKEHQCKRCKRAVCDACSPHKAVVEKYDDKKGHRQCYFCKNEADSLKKFIGDNHITFMKDTLAMSWLQAFDLDLDIAFKDYQQAQQEFNQNAPEVLQMNAQIRTVFQEIDDWLSYSLREFFVIVIPDQKKANTVIEKILATFLSKYPQVGWSPDLVLITQFLLCFGSESVAYCLLTVIYGNIMPSYLYNTVLRTKAYDFTVEVNMTIAVLENGLRVQPADVNSIKYFLQNRIQRYILTLGLNFLLFETSYFLFNQMFLGGQEGYDEMIKAFASVLALQSDGIKKCNVNYDEAELIILKNARAQQASGQFVQTKKVSLDFAKKDAEKLRQPTIQTRSVSMAIEKEQAQKYEKEGMKIELQTLRQENEKQKATIEQQSVELNKLKADYKATSVKLTTIEQEYKQVKDQYDQILEENQSLKIEKMKREAVQATLVASDVADAELIKQIENYKQQQIQLKEQIDQLVDQLDEQKNSRIKVEESLEQERRISEKERENKKQLENQVKELQQIVLQANQQLELLQISNQKEGVDSDNKYEVIVVMKNEEIAKLSATILENEGKIQSLQDQLNVAIQENKRSDVEKDNMRKEISSLEKEMNKLRQDMSQNKPIERNNSLGSAVNMAIILKDLEDGKNLLEKKNAEIIQLKRTTRELEDEIQTLRGQLESQQSQMVKYEQENQDFNQIMRRASSEASEQIQLGSDFDILLTDQDPARRSAARNIKNKMDALEKEVLFRQTEAEIKREQLQPYKDKVKQLEAALNIEQQHSKEVDVKLAKKSDLLAELEKQNAQLQAKVQQYEELKKQFENQMVKPKGSVRGNDKEVLNENNQSCTDDKGCRIF